MTKERTILLIFLEFLVLGLLWQTVGISLKQERIYLNEEIHLNNRIIKRYQEGAQMKKSRSIQKSEQIKNLQQKVIYLYNLFDSRPDLYKTAMTVKEELQKRGLVINSYGELDGIEGPILEYDLSGSIGSFLLFLDNPGSPVKISYFSVNSQNKPSRITLGMAPARLPESLTPSLEHIDLSMLSDSPPRLPVRLNTADELSALFLQPVMKSFTPPLITKPVQTAQPIQKIQLSYIGRVKTNESGVNYGFKESATKKMILINSSGEGNSRGWALKQEESNRFFLTHNGHIHEVNK